MTSTLEAAALVPPAFREQIGRRPADTGPSGAEWAAGLPRLLAEVLDEWSLTPTAVGHTGWTALVVPVLRDGEPLALKLVWPHLEARDEALVLRHWDGRGAVRMSAADPARGALLLEALDAGRDLGSVDIDEACRVAGGLLRRLHRPAPPGLRPLSVFAREQVARLEETDDVLPRRMVERTAGLVRELTSDPACDATLLHTDLHYRNVLAGRREPWLAIDPHAMAGHPGFEIQPLLRNRTEELGSGAAFRYLARRRLEIVCDEAGIDEDLARAWTYVHTAFEARWSAQEGNAAWVTLSIALMKALAD